MKDALPLVGILTLGLALRVWGLAFGLPETQARPDEIMLVSVAMDFLRGQFWPAFFDYPRLVPYLFAGLYAAYATFGQLVGWFQSFGEFLATWKQWWPPLFLLSRWVSAICGTLTIVAIYRLAASAFNRRVALVSAFFLAVAFLAVRESHYATTDALMTLLCWLALAILVRAYETGRRRALWIGTLVAALALSAKYSAAPLCFSVASVIGLLWREGRMSSREALSQFVWLVVFGALVFLALNSYIILDWVRFRVAMDLLAASYKTGMATASGLPPGWLFHIVVSLQHGVGWPILVAGLAGIVLLGRRNPGVALILGSFAVVFYVAIARSNLLFVRYVLPLVPLFCLAAAATVDAIVERVPGRLRTLAASFMALALATPSGWASIQFDRLLTRTDSRSLAARWIVSNVPPGARIAQSGSEYGRVHLPWGHNYRIWSFHPRFNAFVEGRWDPVSGTPDYIVVQESPLPYSYVVPPMKRLLDADYELVHVVRAVRMEQQEANVYDVQDAFFLPYGGFDGVSRPGPNLYIYRRRPAR